MKYKNISVGIFASGKGTRFREITKGKIPKCMVLLDKKPMVSYIVENLGCLGFKKPILLVGFLQDVVRGYFKDRVSYVVQGKCLGTGHAGKILLDSVKDKNIKYLMIFQGDDSAFYTTKVIRNFINDFLEKKAVLSFMTVELDDPSGYGRVIRNKKGEITEIIEKENLKKEHCKFREINAAGYIFDIDWMRENIKKLTKHMPKGEYYLPDLIKIAIAQGEKVTGYKIPESNWVGVNTKEEYVRACKLMKKRSQ
jgi:bifunctional UDP-N-acetylglucosamine pyrophosphorylase/glucosamine-1-phosphate N-acetyltransferase